jgi:hypothetical protein
MFALGTSCPMIGILGMRFGMNSRVCLVYPLGGSCRNLSSSSRGSGMACRLWRVTAPLISLIKRPVTTVYNTNRRLIPKRVVVLINIVCDPGDMRCGFVWPTDNHI